jgi:hypothetical protein
MHSPSLLTPMIANQVIGDHTRAARRHRESTRRTQGPIGRLRARRSGASPGLVPRGRPIPRIAR